MHLIQFVFFCFFWLVFLFFFLFYYVVIFNLYLFWLKSGVSPPGYAVPERLYKGLFSETKLSVHKGVNTTLLQRTVANNIIFLIFYM